MNIPDALYEYAKSEIVPMVAGESELMSGLLNGVLKASKKKIAGKLSDNQMLSNIGLLKDNGEIDIETVRDFFDGVFESRENLPISLADILKAVTGISSDNEMLQDKIKFTRADADRVMDLLVR